MQAGEAQSLLYNTGGAASPEAPIAATDSLLDAVSQTVQRPLLQSSESFALGVPRSSCGQRRSSWDRQAVKGS